MAEAYGFIDEEGRASFDFVENVSDVFSDDPQHEKIDPPEEDDQCRDRCPAREVDPADHSLDDELGPEQETNQGNSYSGKRLLYKLSEIPGQNHIST